MTLKKKGERELMPDVHVFTQYSMVESAKGWQRQQQQQQQARELEREKYRKYMHEQSYFTQFYDMKKAETFDIYSFSFLSRRVYFYYFAFRSQKALWPRASRTEACESGELR
jgi:hypothetical protein